MPHRSGVPPRRDRLAARGTHLAARLYEGIYYVVHLPNLFRLEKSVREFGGSPTRAFEILRKAFERSMVRVFGCSGPAEQANHTTPTEVKHRDWRARAIRFRIRISQRHKDGSGGFADPRDDPLAVTVPPLPCESMPRTTYVGALSECSSFRKRSTSWMASVSRIRGCPSTV